MNNFFNPTSVIFGDDAIKQLPDILSDFGRNVLFLSGQESLGKNSAFNDIYPKIKPYISKHISGISSMPDLADILELIQKQNGKYDGILAIGGGSVMDAAKALSALYSNRSLSIDGLRKAILANKFAIKKIPVITVPTTAGTGSETNQWATIWDKELLTHYTIGDSSTFPEYAIIDARLSESMPPRITVASGLDALSHATEGFWAKNGNAISKLYAAKAVSLVLSNLEQAVKTNHIRHRTSMAIASAMAGVSLSIANTTLCHALSYPLTVEHGMDHGVASALTLADAYQFNKGSFVDEQYFEELLVKGIHHQSLGNFVKHVCTLAEIPTRLADYGITREILPEIAEKAYKAEYIDNNPKEADVNDLLDLLKKAY